MVAIARSFILGCESCRVHKWFRKIVLAVDQLEKHILRHSNCWLVSEIRSDRTGQSKTKMKEGSWFHDLAVRVHQEKTFDIWTLLSADLHPVKETEGSHICVALKSR